MGKALFRCLVCLLVVGCGPTGTAVTEQQGASREDDIAAITAVSGERAAAFNRSDAAAIAAHFTEDAVLMAPNHPATTGRAAVEAYYQAIFDSHTPELTSGYEEVEVAGDLAYGRGYAEVVLRPRNGGEAVRSTAKYLNILQRQPDGSWKTTHDCWNGNE